MLQEIVVPIVTVKHVKGKLAQETKTKPVTVQVLGASHRITTIQHRFQLIQMEAVSDREIRSAAGCWGSTKAVSRSQ